MQIARRGFITGLASLIVAPSIVRASSLMPVSSKLLRPNIVLDPMRLDEYAMRVMQPMIGNLQRQIADTIMNGSNSFPRHGLLA